MVLRNFFCAAGDTWTVSQRQVAVHVSAITASETATRGTLTFAKNVADYKDETQHRDRKEHVHEQLATDELVDQLHISAVNENKFSHRWTQISTDFQSLNFRNLC